MSHARLSPSGLKRTLNCAAAANREANYPDKSSEASMKGDNQHAILEEALDQGKWPPENPIIPHPELEVDTEQMTMVKQCYDYIMEQKANRMPCAIEAEVKVDPGLYTGRTDGAGKGDCLIVDNRMLEVVDYKSGGIYVEEDDPQLRAYGLGAMARYADPAKNYAIPFETIRLTVFQPRRPGKLQTARSKDFTPEELTKWANEYYRPRAAATDDPNAKGTVGDWCTFCKAKDDCPDRAENIGRGAEILGDKGLLMSSTPIEELSIEELAELIEIAPVIRARLADADERGTKLLKDRKPVPGQKLVRGKGSRGWKLDEDEMKKKLKNLKLKQDEYMPRKLATPPQIEKLGLHLDTMKKIQKFIEDKPGKLTMVPESDPRPNAMPAVGFEPVNQEAPAEEAPALPDFLKL